MADIIIVEDNEEIGGLLMDFLVADGYDVYHALSGEEALDVWKDEGAKLLILDVMLPGIDGFAICQEIRKESNTPIIIVSAKNAKEDKINGLILGADDFIEKPYDIDILLAKISGIFARRYASDTIVDGNVKLDKIARKVFVEGEEKTMTFKEFDLLLYMLENKGQVLKKEELFNKIWGFDSESELQTLTVHIKWLREKVPNRINTVWGVGYRFE